jgi:hypothetical protein
MNSDPTGVDSYSLTHPALPGPQLAHLYSDGTHVATVTAAMAAAEGWLTDIDNGHTINLTITRKATR